MVQVVLLATQTQRKVMRLGRFNSALLATVFNAAVRTRCVIYAILCRRTAIGIRKSDRAIAGETTDVFLGGFKWSLGETRYYECVKNKPEYNFTSDNSRMPNICSSCSMQTAKIRMVFLQRSFHQLERILWQTLHVPEIKNIKKSGNLIVN